MNGYKTPLRDLAFSLFEVLSYDEHCQNLEGNEPLDRETAMMLLSEFGRFCEDVVAPLNASGDSEGCRMDAGEVRTPGGFPESYRQYAAGGWFSLASEPALGGQGLPSSLAKVTSEILCSANMGFALYTSAIPGAIATLRSYGTDEQRSLYERRLISGEWNATMCLTEPHCGTDLGLLRTKAVARADGRYEITGTKIFITGGEHDLTENIVHLVLARSEGAPAGTGGISLFIVPKRLSDENGALRERNSVSCGSIEKKMGVKASATCVLNFDAATGYLLGRENRGLAAMFTFINASRISAASQGVAHAELGFQKSLAYAKDRLQMRSLGGPRNPEQPADPIIVHPDVRRMLLTQKAFAEGNRLFNHFLAMQLDLVGADTDESRRAQALLDLLTPMAKAFATETGVESANLALQCFGGHGYIHEWGVEQNLRDSRIATIYEGTTGVQALDLLGRKVLGGQGAALDDLLSQIQGFCAENESDGGPLAEHCASLTVQISDWRELTTVIAERAAANPEEVGAASVDYLMYSGYVLVGYFWLRSGAVASAALHRGTGDAAFYKSKLAVADFYFEHILPRTSAHGQCIRAGGRTLMSLPADDFQF
ncbi:MAG: acyl-CoA dehydrogenase C-terminal domain-containing protein [Pseudomonadota bacterium]